MALQSFGEMTGAGRALAGVYCGLGRQISKSFFL
jgi:hypothetical protein